MNHPQSITFVFDKDGLKAATERAVAYVIYEHWIESAYELRISMTDVSYMKLYVPVREGDLWKDTAWVSETIRAEWDAELADLRKRFGGEAP